MSVTEMVRLPMVVGSLVQELQLGVHRAVHTCHMLKEVGSEL